MRQVPAAWAGNPAEWIRQAATTINALVEAAPLPPCRVSELPTTGQGKRGFVTDASGPVFGSAVVGGGSVGAPVVFDGTDWIVG